MVPVFDQSHNLGRPSQDGRTPLMLAAKNAHAEAVRLLLAQGAHVNAAAGPEVSPQIQPCCRRAVSH